MENGCTNTVPSEIYGWFAINKLFRLDATDIAMVKAQTASYKLDDVLIAMRKMWGGDSLSKRDAEKRKGPSATKTFVATAEPSWTDEPHEDHETAWMNTQDGEPNDSEDDLEESQVWFDQASTALADQPTDPAVLANFQEARKNFYKEARWALDKHRVARGFYPSGKGKGKEGANKGFQGRCMRCGKIGHKAMQCKQSLSSSAVSPGPSGGKGADAGRVGFVFAQTAADDHWIADRVTWASTETLQLSLMRSTRRQFWIVGLVSPSLEPLLCKPCMINMWHMVWTPIVKSALTACTVGHSCLATMRHRKL